MPLLSGAWNSPQRPAARKKERLQVIQVLSSPELSKVAHGSLEYLGVGFRRAFSGGGVGLQPASRSHLVEVLIVLLNRFAKKQHKFIIEVLKPLEGRVGQVAQDREEVHGIPRGGVLHKVPAALHDTQHLLTLPGEVLPKAHGSDDISDRLHHQVDRLEVADLFHHLLELAD